MPRRPPLYRMSIMFPESDNSSLPCNQKNSLILPFGDSFIVTHQANVQQSTKDQIGPSLVMLSKAPGHLYDTSRKKGMHLLHTSAHGFFQSLGHAGASSDMPHLEPTEE